MDYQYNQRAEASRKKATYEIAQSCAVPLAPADIVGMCLVDQIETYRKQVLSDQDLEAQQEMARWTAVMGVVGAIGIPLSLMGLVVLWFSLRQTRQAISLDREVGHAQVRAYLSVLPNIRTNIGPGRVPKGDLSVSNSGQSPALDMKHISVFMVLPFPLPDNQGDLIAPRPEDRQRGGSTVTTASPHTVPIEFDGELTAEDVQVIMRGGDRRLYAVSIVYYRDVFRVAHRTKFCAYLERVAENRGRDGQVYGVYGWELAHVHNETT